MGKQPFAQQFQDEGANFICCDFFFRTENVLSAAVCKVKNELSISKLCCFSVKDFYYVVHQQISAHDIFEND